MSSWRSEESSLARAVSELIKQFAAGHDLSARETSVLCLAARGLHRKESAHLIGCTSSTVHTYWRRIFKKTGMSCQSELFARLLSFAVQTKVESP